MYVGDTGKQKEKIEISAWCQLNSQSFQNGVYGIQGGSG